MAIKPLFDKVVIKAIETDEKTASGIVLPGAAKENRNWQEFLPLVPAEQSTETTSKCRSRSAIPFFTANTQAASLRLTVKKLSS